MGLMSPPHKQIDIGKDTAMGRGEGRGREARFPIQDDEEGRKFTQTRRQFLYPTHPTPTLVALVKRKKNPKSINHFPCGPMLYVRIARQTVNDGKRKKVLGNKVFFFFFRHTYASYAKNI